MRSLKIKRRTTKAKLTFNC